MSGVEMNGLGWDACERSAGASVVEGGMSVAGIKEDGASCGVARNLDEFHGEIGFGASTGMCVFTDSEPLFSM